jgi:N6-adenosine-specific RNA methylase IME4
MSAALTKYDAAYKALAAAVRVDEVKKIHDLAMAAELYAKQAKDPRFLAMATDLRKRAERRLGETFEQQRKAGQLAKGAREKGTKRGTTRVAKKPASLDEQGISKALADRARKAAKMPADEFERQLAKTVQVTVAATEGDREVVRAARAEQQAKKRARRAERERELGAKITALPVKKYGLFLIDVPWPFEVYDEATGSDRAAANHYPTMRLEEIKALKIPAADDAITFSWTTVSVLPAALEALAAWGFEYRSAIFWVKDKSGTGYWAQNRVEILLIGVKGRNVPAPAQGEQPPQLIEAPRGRHSEKPEIFAEIIEKLRHCGRRPRLRRRLLQISRSQNNGLSVIAPGLHSRSSRW